MFARFTRVHAALALLTALVLGTAVGAGVPAVGVQPASAAPLTTYVDGPNVACTVQLTDAFVALSGNPNPTETVLLDDGALVVKVLTYGPDLDVLHYELPGIALDAAGTIVMRDRQALGANGHVAYWCDENHVLYSDYLAPGDGSYPEDDDPSGSLFRMSPDGLMGCDSLETSVCKVMAPLFNGVIGLAACTPGRVLSIGHSICEGLRELIRYIRNRWNRGPNPDSWSCPTSVACDTVTGSCAAKKFACRAMKIKNVCWRDLGCD